MIEDDECEEGSEEAADHPEPRDYRHEETLGVRGGGGGGGREGGGGGGWAGEGGKGRQRETETTAVGHGSALSTAHNLLPIISRIARCSMFIQSSIAAYLGALCSELR